MMLFSSFDSSFFLCFTIITIIVPIQCHNIKRQYVDVDTTINQNDENDASKYIYIIIIHL